MLSLCKSSSDKGLRGRLSIEKEGSYEHRKAPNIMGRRRDSLVRYSIREKGLKRGSSRAGRNLSSKNREN